MPTASHNGSSSAPPSPTLRSVGSPPLSAAVSLDGAVDGLIALGAAPADSGGAMDGDGEVGMLRDFTRTLSGDADAPAGAGAGAMPSLWSVLATATGSVTSGLSTLSARGSFSTPALGLGGGLVLGGGDTMMGPSDGAQPVIPASTLAYLGLQSHVTPDLVAAHLEDALGQLTALTTVAPRPLGREHGTSIPNASGIVATAAAVTVAVQADDDAPSEVRSVGDRRTVDWAAVHGLAVQLAQLAARQHSAQELHTAAAVTRNGGDGGAAAADAAGAVEGPVDGDSGGAGRLAICPRPAPLFPLPRPLLLLPPPRGPRLLCLDGGGIRGLLIVEALRRMEAVTGRRIVDSFDLIAGTSTGGMIATALCAGKTLDEIATQYEAIRAAFSGQSSLVSEVRRFAVGASHSHETAQSVLRDFYGPTLRMSDLPASPKCFVVVASANVSPPQPYLFRSYSLPRAVAARAELLGTSSVSIHEAVRATTSAPTYYEAAVVGRAAFVDGAVLANNPALVALTESALLWPDRPASMVVSIGTGTLLPRPYKPAGVMAWVSTMLDLAMSSDLTHRIASTLLSDRYYRLDVEGAANTYDLSEMRLDVLSRMVAEGGRYYERNARVFDAIAAAMQSQDMAPEADVDGGSGGGGADDGTGAGE